MKESPEDNSLLLEQLYTQHEISYKKGFEAGQNTAKKAPMTDDQALKLPLEIGGGYVSIIRQVEKFHGIE